MPELTDDLVPEVADEIVPEVIMDLTEVLLRQVHPIHYPNGVLSSGAFRPGPEHNLMLSTHRNRIGAAESYRRWTEELGYESVGTWGVTVGEADELDLPALADEVLPEVPDDHASVNFAVCETDSQVKRKAKELRKHAVNRTQIYSPGGDAA